MKILLFSIVMGLGLAIPVGPVTIEMMRRNLRYGLARGVMVGVGASSADVAYLLLLLFGVLPLIQDSKFMLHTIGVVGALLLVWFAWKTMRQKEVDIEEKNNDGILWHCFISGFFIAALSPFNILFWIAVAAQFAAIVSQAETDYALACVGLFIGTAIWFVSLNVFIHWTRHRISSKIAHRLNIIGGLSLMAFAAYGVWHVFADI